MFNKCKCADELLLPIPSAIQVPFAIPLAPLYDGSRQIENPLFPGLFLCLSQAAALRQR